MFEELGNELVRLSLKHAKMLGLHPKQIKLHVVGGMLNAEPPIRLHTEGGVFRFSDIDLIFDVEPASESLSSEKAMHGSLAVYGDEAARNPSLALRNRGAVFYSSFDLMKHKLVQEMNEAIDARGIRSNSCINVIYLDSEYAYGICDSTAQCKLIGVLRV